METASHPRGRGSGLNGHGARGRGRGGSKNKHWTTPGAGGTDSDRWERGGHRGGGRGRGAHKPLFARGGAPSASAHEESDSEEEIVTDGEDPDVQETEEEVQVEPEVVEYQEVRVVLSNTHGTSNRFSFIVVAQSSRGGTQKSHR
jgi:hypothetical protein